MLIRMDAEPLHAEQNLHQVKLITDIINYIQQGGLNAVDKDAHGRPFTLTARQCCLLTAVQCISTKLGCRVTLGQLARDLHMSASAASHLVDTLVENGILKRSAHEGDRRSILLSLTPAGEACASSSRLGMLQAIHELTEELTPEENEVRRRMVEKLYRKIYPTAP